MANLDSSKTSTMVCQWIGDFDENF